MRSASGRCGLPTQIYHARDAEKFAKNKLITQVDNLSNLAHAHCCAQATNNLCTSHNNEYELKFVLSAALDVYTVKLICYLVIQY